MYVAILWAFDSAFVIPRVPVRSRDDHSNDDYEERVSLLFRSLSLASLFVCLCLSPCVCRQTFNTVTKRRKDRHTAALPHDYTRLDWTSPRKKNPFALNLHPRVCNYEEIMENVGWECVAPVYRQQTLIHTLQFERKWKDNFLIETAHYSSCFFIIMPFHMLSVGYTTHGEARWMQRMKTAD